MHILPISNLNFKKNATVYDFVDNPTPEEIKTKEHLDAELAKKVPHDRKGRSIIEWVNSKGLEVCYSRPYETVIVKGYSYGNEKPIKVNESVMVNEGIRPYLSRDINFLENRQLEDVDNGVIQVDLTFRKDKESDPNREICVPTTKGYVGDYNVNDSIDFSDIKKVSRILWKPLNVCYGIMSAIGIGCFAGLCWLIPLTLKTDKTKTLPKTDTIGLVEKMQPQKIARDTLEIMSKRI